VPFGTDTVYFHFAALLDLMMGQATLRHLLEDAYDIGTMQWSPTRDEQSVNRVRYTIYPKTLRQI